MKLTVVAATGRIGTLVTEQALAAGHDVTAVARNPAALSTRTRVVPADLLRDGPDVLVPALAGADAVVSCLGRRTAADAGVTPRGTQAIVEAMQVAGVRRVVAISAAPIGTVPSPGRPAPPRHDPGDGLLMRTVLSPLVKTVFRAYYAELAVMEDVLRESGTDWTVVRPPRLTNGPLTGTYRTAVDRNVRRGPTVSRADVAHLVLRVLEQPATVHRTIGLAT
ncbi:NAD(P)-dependent oxidoreductase [Petropleomorpha daqingensis]|uniref:Putative NADH-flavin reductase n=1 Tax=Petropleomorpha daqingensis TaxID=2026353 RepID=A0A853CN53_9ACTN|nr:NAD(P)-binding oxidoreductase [Petropleomorpha daqingensis]NYJ08239.1 putative NADH-flavin reductase [Petropleomorpha daqingensis]